MHVITHLIRNRHAINCLPTNLCTVKFENAENIHKKNQSLEIWVLKLWFLMIPKNMLKSTGEL